MSQCLTQKEPVRCTNKLIKKTTDTKRVCVNAPLDSACAELVTTDSTSLCCYDILLCPRYWQANYSVVTVSVCLSVCLSASISPELHVRSSPKLWACARSILLWRLCDTSCTSGLRMTSYLHITGPIQWRRCSTGTASQTGSCCSQAARRWAWLKQQAVSP